MAEDSASPTAHRPPKQPLTPPEVRSLRSEDLFQGRQEIQIEHAGRAYRLRITKSGKLILYK